MPRNPQRRAEKLASPASDMEFGVLSSLVLTDWFHLQRCAEGDASSEEITGASWSPSLRLAKEIGDSVEHRREQKCRSLLIFTHPTVQGFANGFRNDTLPFLLAG